MDEQALARALEITRTAIAEAGKELIKHFGQVEAETKSGIDSAAAIVTALDRQTEQFLARELGKFDANVGFRGEEFGVQARGDTTWLVDPIDGTSHFVRGLPFCTTMVALIEKGQVIMSVIYDFVRQDTYWAIKDQGAYCNDQKIHVSERPLHQALLSYETNLSQPGNMERYIKLRQTKANTIHIINCGFEFAMVASGKLDGRLTKDPYGCDWDYAPGCLLVSEAGGVVCNLGTTTYDYRNHNFLAVNPVIYKELTTGKNALFANS
ncbi:MAG TPA: inositol monophosphatase [Nevskiaceae bacterium]|nr:inositol monophosphatase [Nevskiaceae bacterium]